MSYRPMVYVQGEWAGNGLRFATHEEARMSASALMDRWMLVENYRVDESSDAVNWAIVEGRQVPVKQVEVAA